MRIYVHVNYLCGYHYHYMIIQNNLVISNTKSILKYKITELG